MAHWLVKSEPGTWSWDQQVAAGKGGTNWNGVRNHQAKAHLKAMQLGDTAFFYHSGEDKAVVGIVEVIKTYYPDPTDPSGVFGMVDFAAKALLANPVTLAAIKGDGRLKEMVLVKNSRLSVQPVTASEWKIVLEMSRG
jgi:predicted RNA-binding protein with PUA-like domain